MTIAQLLKHDFSKDNLYLYDSNGNLIYCEYSYGFWYKREYDSKGNLIYYEYSNGNWITKRVWPPANFQNSHGQNEGERQDWSGCQFGSTIER